MTLTSSGNFQSISTQTPKSLLNVDPVLPRFAETLQKTSPTHSSLISKHRLDRSRGNKTYE